MYCLFSNHLRILYLQYALLKGHYFCHQRRLHGHFFSWRHTDEAFGLDWIGEGTWTPWNIISYRQDAARCVYHIPSGKPTTFPTHTKVSTRLHSCHAVMPRTITLYINGVVNTNQALVLQDWLFVMRFFFWIKKLPNWPSRCVNAVLLLERDKSPI